VISVQDFAFRERPLSLLVASAYPAGVSALLSNQPLEVPTYMKPTFTITMKKIRTIHRSDLLSTTLLLSQPL
jgi:hypothetical protein